MGDFRYGCETFSWIMSGDKYIGKMPHLCQIISQAGLTGVETNGGIMADYYRDSDSMKELLAEHDLALASLSYGGAFNAPKLDERELRQAERAFDYIASFPEPRLSISHGSRDRSNLAERQKNAIACINETARRATDRGIACAFHPTSGGYSIFRTADDYNMLLSSLDSSVVGYCPDSGHIVNGDMDIYELFSTYASIIRHVHFKDITEDKSWAPMGEGIIDFGRLLGTLRKHQYDGWIIIEEESSDAREDPDTATLTNGRYVSEILRPLGF